MSDGFSTGSNRTSRFCRETDQRNQAERAAASDTRRFARCCFNRILIDSERFDWLPGSAVIAAQRQGHPLLGGVQVWARFCQGNREEEQNQGRRSCRVERPGPHRPGTQSELQHVDQGGTEPQLEGLYQLGTSLEPVQIVLQNQFNQCRVLISAEPAGHYSGQRAQKHLAAAGLVRKMNQSETFTADKTLGTKGSTGYSGLTL